MRPRRRLAVLLTVLVCLLALFGAGQALRPDPSRRNYEIFTEMQYSVAYEPLSANPVYRDGKHQQPLVAGVVPRGASWFPFGTGEEEAQRAGRDLTSMLAPGDAAALQAGGRLYQIYCVPCHGATGDGRGPVARRGMVPPPSFLAARARSLPDGHLYHILTRGQGNMAAYAAQLAPEERWQVIAYLRSLQEEGDK